MKKLLLTIITLSLAFASHAQMRGQRRPMTPTQPPSESQKEAQEEKLEERKEEFIENFLKTLDADEFQLQIIKQTIDSYFEEKIELFKVQYTRSFEREEAVRLLNESHFKELKTLISESDMTKINDMINGKFDEKEVIRKNKKKKRKKSKD